MAAIRRVIVDCDAGSDDYLAILILLDAHKRNIIKIEAIVCTAGNTTVENVSVNVMRLLENVSQTKIPVFKGASLQLIPPTIQIDYFHGKDGLGDLTYATQPDMSLIRPEPAPQGIYNLCRQYPNEISLLCTGPLTTLALTLRVYNNVPLKDLWVMGGNYTAVGNITSTAEFNFVMDPESVHIVFSTIKQPIYLFPWETCLTSGYELNWWLELSASKAKGSKAWDILYNADKKIYKNSSEFYPCDAYLAATFLNPELYVMKQSKHHITIELHGSETRGQLVLDHMKRKPVNVILLEELNLGLFKKLLVELS